SRKNRHQYSQHMSHKGDLHDHFTTDFMIKKTTQYHRYRKSKKPHRIDETQFFSRQVELCSNLGQNSRSDSKRQCSSNECKATLKEKSVAICNCIQFERFIGLKNYFVSEIFFGCIYPQTS